LDLDYLTDQAENVVLHIYLMHYPWKYFCTRFVS